EPRLAAASRGVVALARSSEFDRADPKTALGFEVLGSGTSAHVNEDDKGKLLRLVLDDALRKMLPKLDELLVRRSQPLAAPADPGTAPAGTVTPASAPRASGTASETKRFCPHCGKQIAPGTRFCPYCGEKVSD